MHLRGQVKPISGKLFLIQKMLETNATLSDIWNQVISLDHRPRVAKSRDYIYASEIGKSAVDVWLAMNGVEPTNPPNARARRKFKVGSFFERYVEIVLFASGLLEYSQYRVNSKPIEGGCEVHGLCDFVIGGKPSVDRYMKHYDLINRIFDGELNEEEMTDDQLEHIKKYGKDTEFADIGLSFVTKLAEAGFEMERRKTELKTVGERMFGYYQRAKGAMHHKAQAYHYIEAEDNSARVLYVSREDLLLFEVVVEKEDEAVKNFYNSQIIEMSGYYLRNEQPPLAPLLIWDDIDCKFKKNWHVEYSNYITKLYGYQQPSDYSDEMKGLTGRFNRVLTRIQKGEKMTDNNQAALAEMAQFANVDEVIAKLESKIKPSEVDEWKPL